MVRNDVLVGSFRLLVNCIPSSNLKKLGFFQRSEVPFSGSRLMPFFLNIQSAHIYPRSVDMIPRPAPTSTSLIQWRLLSVRMMPVVVAHPYAKTDHHGERVRPYSLCMMVAAVNAVQVWPDGNELAVEPSGRISLAEYFMVLTKSAHHANDIPPLTRYRHVLLRP